MKKLAAPYTIKGHPAICIRNSPDAACFLIPRAFRAYEDPYINPICGYKLRKSEHPKAYSEEEWADVTCVCILNNIMDSMKGTGALKRVSKRSRKYIAFLMQCDNAWGHCAEFATNQQINKSIDKYKKGPVRA